MVCVGVVAAVEVVVVVLCGERGSCLSMPRDEALCENTLAENGE